MSNHEQARVEQTINYLKRFTSPCRLMPISALRWQAVGLAIMLLTVCPDTCQALDCEPKVDCIPKKVCTLREDLRNCDAPDSPPCPLQTDSRDCYPSWNCDNCDWFDVACQGRKGACEANKSAYRSSCESAKAIQNAVYAAQRTACLEANAMSNHSAEDAQRKVTCEEARSAQNALFASEQTKCKSEVELERLECERGRAQQRAACEAGLRGPFSCSADETIRRLSTMQLPFIDKTQQRISWLTASEVKMREGWIDTACVAKGSGIPYRDAVLSSDGFWTIDLKLDSFSIGDVQKPAGDRYLRLVLRPQKWGGGKAHEIADNHYITTHDRINFSGPVIIDRAPPPALELHAVDGLEVIPKN